MGTGAVDPANEKQSKPTSDYVTEIKIGINHARMEFIDLSTQVGYI